MEMISQSERRNSPQEMRSACQIVSEVGMMMKKKRQEKSKNQILIDEHLGNTIFKSPDPCEEVISALPTILGLNAT